MSDTPTRIEGQDCIDLRCGAELPSWLRRLSQWADKSSATFNLLGTVVTLGLMLAITLDVVGRVVINRPLNGIPELATLSVVAIVFLQISQAFSLGRLTRSTVVPTLIGRRCQICRTCLETLFDLAAASIVSIVFYFSAPLFLKSFAAGTFIGAVGIFTIPVWPVKCIILLGCAMLIIQCLLSALRRIYALRQHVRSINTHDSD